MNTSVKVVLYTSKKLSSGTHPVMLRITKERKPKYISVGVSCSKEMWNFKTNTPQKRHPHYQDIKVRIDQKILEAEKFILDLENERKNLSAHEIKVKLKREKVKNSSVFSYFSVVVERLKKSGHIKNAEVYGDTKRNISHFTDGKDFQFSDIDGLFLNRLEEYFQQNGKGGNTIYIYLRTLRALINKAIKEEVCSEKYYAFNKFSLSKYSKIKTDKRAISKDEIEKIAKVNLIKNPELVLAQKMFLFSFYCRGMNFVDMANLKWKDINNGRVVYQRQKAKEHFNIELLDPARNILEYIRQNYERSHGYIFPIFGEGHKTPQSKHNRRVKMLRQINADLKNIAVLAGITTDLTTYVARHSFATILKKKGVSVAVISESLGHDSEKTTQTYLESFGNSVLDEASKVIL